MIQRKFSPKFNPTNIIYNGVTDVWLGDGQTETRPDFNDIGKLYVQYGERADPVCLGPVSSYAVAKDAGYTGTPEEWQTIISGAENAQSYAEDAGESADLAEAWATGSTDSSHPAHDNSAKDWAETARAKAVEAETARAGANTERNAAAQEASNAAESASAAEEDALTSEAYAVGTRNGIDVDSNDPAYNNNAKYYTETLSNVANMWEHSSYEEKEAVFYNAADNYLNAHDITCWRLGPFLIIKIYLTFNGTALTTSTPIGSLLANYTPYRNFVQKVFVDSLDGVFGGGHSGIASVSFNMSGTISIQNNSGAEGSVRHTVVYPAAPWIDP